jgi:spermidine synthase
MEDVAVEHVEIARASSARGDVVLRMRREDDLTPPVYELRVNGVFVMDTLETGSEEAMARVALAEVTAPRSVLIGGLGLGFTAQAVLADRRVEQVVVVEIEEALVRWMRDGTVPHGAARLADERLTLVTGDIRQAVAEAAPATYDLVLLDVDNGPGHLVHEHNAAVYDADFLRDLAEVLRPAGALVVWSASQAPQLANDLASIFSTATPLPFDVRLQERDEQFWLYLARR